MKKIELKVNNDKLNVLVELLNFAYSKSTQEQDYSTRMLKSMYIKILKSLSKKNIDKIDVRKEFKLSFEYHYFAVIFETLQGALDGDFFKDDTYKTALIRTMSNQIHQQL
ncbi:hypothetical protein [Empedobacter sp.]|uniref:hypothetical protein n=1 Tax=Empedobacter sp. TaxID=1927715 RepID=UPI0028AEE8C6|nr:hypothetical protein [Empedobacter sp.]